MLAELWRQYKHEGSVDAREEIILKCLPIVKSLAIRFSTYTSPCCDTDDLINTGIIGLLDALEKYDPTMRASFSTYAKYRIRGAILDEIRNLQWVPRSIKDKIQILKRSYTRLEHNLTRPPTEKELADDLGMDLRGFRKMLVQIGPPTILALSHNHFDNDNVCSHEVAIEDPNTIYPVDQVIRNETKSLLADAIGSLPERETLVITLYYYEEMTMREIGETLSLTESRICQIHASALLRLFQCLRAKIALEGEPVRQKALAN